MIKYKEFINEKMGVSEDSEILSEFLIQYLDIFEPDNIYLFISDIDQVNENEIKDVKIIQKLPKLSKKIYKLYVECSDNIDFNIEASFESRLSFNHEKGYVLFFKFTFDESVEEKIKKYNIYHETLHSVQFMNMGDDMKYIPENVIINIMRHVKKSDVYNEFMDLLYLTVKVEQGAFIQQLYGKLKYKKNIQSIEDLKKYYDEKELYEFEYVYDLATVDLNDLFYSTFINKDGVEEDSTNVFEMLIFFSILKKVSKITHNSNSLEGIQDFLKYLVENNNIELEEKEVISQEELNATIKYYTKYFNKTGQKMIRKINKIFPLLQDLILLKNEK